MTAFAEDFLDFGGVRIMIFGHFGNPGAYFGGPGAHVQDVWDCCDLKGAPATKKYLLLEFKM